MGGNSSSGEALRGTLGVGSIVFMVTAAAAPLGAVVALTPVLFSSSGSVGAPLYFLVAGAVLMLFAVGFTTMTRYVENAGAFYSYVRAGLGELPGIGTAFVAVVAYTAMLGSALSYVGQVVVQLVERWTGHGGSPWLWASAFGVIVGLLGYRNIEIGGRVLGVALVVEAASVLLVDLAIVARGGHDGLSLASLSPLAATTGAHAPGFGLMLAFLTFTGFEATVVFRGEARDPDRTIPRATFLALGLIGTLYAFSAWATAVGVGTDRVLEVAEADPTGMYLDLAAGFVAPAMRDVLQVLLVTSYFAGVLSVHNVVARYLWSLGAQSVAPEALAAVHPRHGSPGRASLVTTGLTAAILLSAAVLRIGPLDVYLWLSWAGTLGILAMLLLVCLAVLVFFRRTGHDRRLWHTLLAPLGALIALTGALAVIVRNFTQLVGDGIAPVLLLAVVPIVFGLGMIRALTLSARRADAGVTAADEPRDRSGRTR
ncbi:APC family permease [Nocardia sp. CDC159]|uniref:APC family permease n=1 Tax=Nocardia pulmonis TaxID=2951408 RepID=A0A9X2EDS9_9NOCA|nr:MULTISPECIES: APC family permease [Nocardia]MCM6776383.1 APC family permease [Nocardia pulmonis]MCM6788807.1 APC family permease [Nocardia sp. CDC159]